MKFEQLLQIYWSKGFLYGGHVTPFDLNLNDLFNKLPGLGKKSKSLFSKRFELRYFLIRNDKSLNLLSLNTRKVFNMYFSQINSINYGVKDLVRYNVIRLYLIKSFRGRAQALGKPCRGQRTWSNAWTAYKYNKILRIFIQQVKKKNIIKKQPEVINFKKLKKKFKKVPTKIKMVNVQKKTNLWF